MRQAFASIVTPRTSCRDTRILFVEDCVYNEHEMHCSPIKVTYYWIFQPQMNTFPNILPIQSTEVCIPLYLTCWSNGDDFISNCLGKEIARRLGSGYIHLQFPQDSKTKNNAVKFRKELGLLLSLTPTDRPI